MRTFVRSAITVPAYTSEVEQSGIDHRLGWVVTAEHNHQVADHRCLTFLVEIDHVTIAETLKGELDHAHRSLDDVLAGGDDGRGLLAAQHRLGDLWRVGDPDDLAVHDSEPGSLDPAGDFGQELVLTVAALVLSDVPPSLSGS